MTALADRADPNAAPTGPPVVFDARAVTESRGGPDRSVLNSPRFLAQVGYRVVSGYLHPPGDPGFESKSARSGAALVSVPDRGPWDWKVVTDLLAACRREKVAVWHGHDSKTNALGLLLRQFWPMRLVTTAHGWVHHSTRPQQHYRLDQMCLPRYDRVICDSDDLLEACTEFGVPAENCVLLEHAIDTEEFRRRQSAEEAKAALGFPLNTMLVGAVGPLLPESAFDLLVRSVQQLVERDVDVRLVVLGEGDDHARLEGVARTCGVADRLSLPGLPSNVPAYFEAMDVFAMTSLRAGPPSALLEAMALEVPAVSARVAGIPRLIQDGRNGFLVEPDDLAALTRSLHGLLTNRGLRDLFSRAGRRTVETRYSFPVRVQHLKRIYDELLGHE